VDHATGGELTRVKTPWLVREVDWTKQRAKRAVIWLSKTLDKAIPQLGSGDFYRNQLHGLVHRYDHIDDLTREVFEDLRRRVTYQENVLSNERVIVFSPHPDDAQFLDMPFYQTGRVRKDPISEADVEVVLDLLDEVQPTNIFVVGDLSDPHGTHRMCYQAIDQALQQYRSAAAGGDGEMSDTNPDPQVWLYRGAWQEWETYRADVFLPLSKADLDRKVEALYKHGSQKDRAMFPGAYDEREFWQRARDRNCDTADTLNQLSLPEFYAAEAFVTTYQMP